MAIHPVSPGGDQPRLLFGRPDPEDATQILWPPKGKEGLPGEEPDAGSDRWQKEKGTAEDEVAGWGPWGDLPPLFVSMPFPGEPCAYRDSYSVSLPSWTLVLEPPSYVAETTLTDLEILIPEPYEYPDGDLYPCDLPPSHCHLPPVSPLVFASFVTELLEA
ncbi:Chaperone protein DnaK [Varanus komodoensis]|nr:Chaperone protein DnaK [Varanus komodoensis]